MANTISLIVATANNNVVGLNNRMPWHLPKDLQYFKATTMKKPMIMGRKTWDSIGGRPLPGRPHFVISRQKDLVLEGAQRVANLEEALVAANQWIVANQGPKEIMVIGGGEIYRQALPLAQRVYRTLIELDVNGDTFFPELKSSEWKLVSTQTTLQEGGFPQVAKTGAVTLIQRFGSALNLNVHFHMLFLDGVYVEQSHGSARFRWVKAPTSPELTQLTHTIAHRVGRYLERQGLLERDVENSYLASDAVDDDPMTPLLGHSITYRIAVGSQAGRKVFTLQTLPTSGDPFGDGIGKVAGSSLHAGVAARADERKKLERLCRYISRPAVSEKRLSLTRGGNVRYQLKTPYRDGTTHVIFEPLDFIARLAALVPKPRVNLTRFHGVFAPNSRHRALVTPAKRGRGNKVRVADEPATPAQRRASMTWAQRLKRVFNIDIETCSGCGGAMKVIACIEDPIVIKQILDHLKHKAETSGTRALPESRAPPAELLLGLFD
ncbi:dihydrofolate reductase [Escherichia coli]|uniref:dihydrofolate reductase n=1 Tax=Escherichia coli TaxID=562 RepID=UPI003F587F28